MLKTFLFAIAFVLFAVTFVHSETFMASIIKVDGNQVTYKKATYHLDYRGAPKDKYTYDEPVVAEVTKDVAVSSGHFVPAKKPNTSEGVIIVKSKAAPVVDGTWRQSLGDLEKYPRRALITISGDGADKGKITAIIFWRSAFPK